MRGGLLTPYLVLVRYHFRDKFDELLGYGIFAVDGDMWKVQRCVVCAVLAVAGVRMLNHMSRWRCFSKQASHMFSVNSFRHHMADVFNRNGNHVVQLLDKAASTGEIIDLQVRLCGCMYVDVTKLPTWVCVLTS